MAKRIIRNRELNIRTLVGAIATIIDDRAHEDKVHDAIKMEKSYSIEQREAAWNLWKAMEFYE